MGYQLPVGPWPLFGEKETTAVAFTGFSNPRSMKKKTLSFFPPLKQKRKVLMPRKRLQIRTTSRPFSEFLTPTHLLFFFFLPYSLCVFMRQKNKVFSAFCPDRRQGKGRKSKRKSQVLSPVSLLVAMKDTVRIPSNYSVCEPPFSLRPPVDRAAK